MIQKIPADQVPAAFGKISNQFVGILVGIISAELYNRFSSVELPTQEVRDIVNTRNVEPEHGVQRVVQTNRDQQTVEERVHARTDRTQFLDVLTEVHQCRY